MANERTSQKASSSGQNRILVLLLAFAMLSSAVKDLDRLQSVTRRIHSATSSWMQLGSTVYASEIDPVSSSCPEALAQSEKSEEFHWVGQIAGGQALEIKGINGGITAEPARNGEIEVLAVKKGRQSNPSDVDIKVVPHAAGVTICAVYPSEYSDRPNSCEPGRAFVTGSKMDRRESSATINVRHNDVSVDFKVKVPAGVEFIGRTINGEISARSLTGNVDSHTVNGSIDISTKGYARAKTVNGEITAKMGRADWSDALEFKTVNGGIDLDLPQTLSTRLDAETFNGDISSDFPLKGFGRVSRKHVTGTIGDGGRELLLKTLNGSIRIRRVS
jgi:Putative adhesin